MAKRKYTIEASAATLAKFCNVAAVYREGVAGGVNGASFIYRVTPDRNEEHYFVVIDAPKDTHQALGFAGFINSKSVL